MTSRRRFLRLAAAGAAVLPAAGAARRVAAAETGMGEARFVDVGGVRTRYFVAGHGAPLVLVHGGQFGMDYDATHWRPVFGRLAERYRVYAFDKLGQGETDLPQRDEDWTMAAVIEHARGFVDAMGLERFHLAGHSRGGLPAARIALDWPERVERLVVFNSNTLAPDDPATPVDYYVKLLAADPPQSPKWPEAKRKLEALTEAWTAAHPERVADNPALGIALAPSPWWLYDLKYETLERLRAGELRAPALIVWGFDDASAPYKLGVKLVDLIAPVTRPTRFYVLNACGHAPHHDHPAEVVRLMNDFLEHVA